MKEKVYFVLLITTFFVFVLFNFSCVHALQKEWQPYILLLFLGSMVAASMVVVEFVHYLRRIDYEKEALEVKKKLQNEYFHEIEKEKSRLADLKANVSKHMETLEKMLENSDIEESKEYADSVLQEYNKKRWKKMCNQPLLDAVLHAKIDVFEEMNIRFDVDSYISEKLPFSESELISIFHNLINNAIEACSRMDDGKERWITFRSGVKNGVFIIHCANSRKKNERIFGRTWKKDVASHGLGKKIVRRIVEKHRGTVLYEQKKESYSVILTVQIQSSEAK